ncbi:MAG: Arc family DNA-binding protein [Bacteroidetes bacterium]|nr:Arc family DNA-binding protein [Bacteroidota bacterium]
MSKKKAFVLRIQPQMMEALEKWAADDFRSVNGQIEYLLNESLKKAGRKKKTEK